MIAPRISMVNGVSQVQVQGAAKYAVRVQVDPDKLHAQQIGINEIDQALQNWNVNLPTGQLFGPTSTYNIKAGGQLMNAGGVPADRRRLPQRRAGPPRPGRQRHRQRRERLQRQLVLHEGRTASRRQQRAITLQVMRQPGSNTIEVTDAVRALLPSFEAQLPPSVHLTPRQDRSQNHPRGVQRHPGHDARHAAPGGRRHLPLPAQRLGDAHSGAGAAVLDPRHVRRHAAAALQPRTTCR